LIELYRDKFGEHTPLIRRQDVKGFVQRKPVWLIRPLRLEEVRKQASTQEVESRQFYIRAAARASDTGRPPTAGRSGPGRVFARESRRRVGEETAAARCQAS
jgi:Rubrerythrin